MTSSCSILQEVFICRTLLEDNTFGQKNPGNSSASQLWLFFVVLSKVLECETDDDGSFGEKRGMYYFCTYTTYVLEFFILFYQINFVISIKSWLDSCCDKDDHNFRRKKLTSQSFESVFRCIYSKVRTPKLADKMIKRSQRLDQLEEFSPKKISHN